MTQTEYEQKRAECWIEFCKEHPIETPSMSIGEAFAYAFDRAYALGSEKETVAQEEIESKAVGYAMDVNNDRLSTYPEAIRPQLYPEYDMDDLTNAFEAGAQFALGKQEKDADTVIQGWVARDEDNTLTLFYGSNKPSKEDGDDYWSIVFGNTLEYLNQNMFPDVTWNDPEPTRVEIAIKRKKRNL